MLLPLAALGAWPTWRARPVWAALAASGTLLLLAWPTKWPQYLLTATPAYAVCAAVALDRRARVAAARLRALATRARA